MYAYGPNPLIGRKCVADALRRYLRRELGLAT